MQQYPILQTKLYIPPVRPDLVSRPRLVERLSEGLPSGRKLTLISAPSGFGKTTLGSEWILVAYWVAGGTLVVLALALHERLKAGSPALVQTATVFGFVWAALIIGSGNLMLYDFGVISDLYGKNPAQAEMVWLALDAVETGIVSGNEIVGSLWVLLPSLAALRTGGLPRALNYLGMALGVAGILPGILAFIPAVQDFIMIFGLGMIV